MARSNTFTKIVVTLIALAGLAFLFWRSVQSSRSSPYTAELGRLRNWTLAIEPATGPAAPVLALRPPPEFAMGLFNQVFARTMESLSVPGVSGMPLLLRGEFDRAFSARTPLEALADVARRAGLESVPLKPVCLASRRVSAPGVTRQLYFVIFEAPAFERFRADLRAMRESGGGTGIDFDPAALSPVLLIGESEPPPGGWLPLRADPEADCVAPIAAG